MILNGGLSLLWSMLWLSFLSLETFHCVLGPQCYLRTVSCLIPSHGGQRGRAAHQDDGALQKKFQISASLLTRMGQMLSRGPGAGTLWGQWDSHPCRKGLGTGFGQATRHRGSPTLGAQALQEGQLSSADPNFPLGRDVQGWGDGLHLGRAPFKTTGVGFLHCVTAHSRVTRNSLQLPWGICCSSWHDLYQEIRSLKSPTQNANTESNHFSENIYIPVCNAIVLFSQSK